MRTYRNLLVVVSVAGVFAAGCGKSEEQKAAEKMAEATKQMGAAIAQAANSAAAQGVAQGTAAMAQGLQAMAQAAQPLGPDGKPLPPVDFEKLIALMPDMPGWEKGKPTGQQMSTPFAMSNAEVRYTKGAERVTLKLTDAVLARMMLSPMMIFMNNYNARTENGYKKSTTVAGAPGFEEWNEESHRGEVTAIVGNRFMVQTTGHGLPNIDSAKSILAAVDMAKLATLK